jgi:hypothetical protein
MHDEALAALSAEIARQDAAFEEFTKALSNLEDGELAVPPEFFEALDGLGAVPSHSAATQLGGIRA